MLKLPKLGKFAILFIPFISWACEDAFKQYTPLELLERNLFIPIHIATDSKLKKQYEDLLKAPISEKKKKEIEHYLKLANKLK